jgi:CBS domain-containing protein
MNLLAAVSTIMTTDPIFVSPEDSLQTVNSIFEKHKVHHVPVVLANELVGMISKSDLSFFKRGFLDDEYNKLAEDLRLNSYKVKNIMTTGLAKLDKDDRINLALDIFAKNLFHALLVVDGKKLLGIVTTHDIIRLLAKDNMVSNTYK